MKKANFWICSAPRNLFRKTLEADKQLIIDKYNELGYRDAMIVKDSVAQYDAKTVDVYMDIDEGQEILPS